jgi:hypothetical protein
MNIWVITDTDTETDTLSGVPHARRAPLPAPRLPQAGSNHENKSLPLPQRGEEVSFGLFFSYWGKNTDTDTVTDTLFSNEEKK